MRSINFENSNYFQLKERLVGYLIIVEREISSTAIQCHKAGTVARIGERAIKIYFYP